MPYRHGGLRRRQSIDHRLLRLKSSVRAYVNQVSDRDSWKLTAATIIGKGGVRLVLLKFTFKNSAQGEVASTRHS